MRLKHRDTVMYKSFNLEMAVGRARMGCAEVRNAFTQWVRVSRQENERSCRFQAECERSTAVSRLNRCASVSTCPTVLRTTVARTQADNPAAGNHNCPDGNMPSGSVMPGGGAWGLRVGFRPRIYGSKRHADTTMASTIEIWFRKCQK